jgi:predicted permease
MIHRLPRIVQQWLGALLARGRAERDLDDELRFFVEERQRRFVEAGLTPREALRRARLEAGGVEQVKEAVRDSWRTRLLDDSVRDIRYGIRALWRAPGFSLVAVLTLALGVGASTAMFSQINAVFLTPLPVTRPTELRLIDWTPLADGAPRRYRPSNRLSYHAYRTLRDHADVFSSVACWSGAVVNFGVDDRLEAHVVSGNYFGTLGADALIGRTLTEDDERHAGKVAVISHALWQRDFGGRESVIRETLPVNGIELRVVGVMPRRFIGLNPGRAADVYLPLSMYSSARFDAAAPRRLDNDRDWSACEVVARMKAGVSDQAARDRAQALVAASPFASDRGSGPRLPSAGDAGVSDEARRLRLVAATFGTDDLREDTFQSLAVLMTATLLVLLIACTNVAGLLMARVPGRAREVGTRLALGASRRRVGRQLVIESLVLAAAASAAGIVLAHALNRLLPGLLGRFISGGADVARVEPATDLRVLMFALLVAAVTGVFFGIAPAVAATRLTLADVMKQAPPPAGTPRRVAGSHALIAAQVGLALVLLIGAGLLLRTIANLRAAETSSLSVRTLYFSASPGSSGYRDADLRDWFQQIVNGLSTTPGVLAAGGMGAGNVCVAHGAREEFVETNAVAPGHFYAAGIPMLEGRDFTWDDSDGQPLVAMANEAFVREYLGRHALGSAVRLCGSLLPRTIVGVVADDSLDPRVEADPALYVPFMQPPPPLTGNIIEFTVRVSRDAHALLPAVRRVVARVDQDVPMFDIETDEGRLDRSIVRERLVTAFVTLYGGIALFLASLGLYGVLAYTVSRRTAEVGVRMALGAARRDVVSMILRESLRPVALGMALGFGAALVLTPWLETVLFEVTPTDPPTFAVAGMVFVAAAIMAALLPALRAARINPMQALRID